MLTWCMYIVHHLKIFGECQRHHILCMCFFRTNVLHWHFKVPMKWNFCPLFYSRKLKSMLHWFIIFEFKLWSGARSNFFTLQSGKKCNCRFPRPGTLRLPGFLHQWDWQKLQHKTDWTQTSYEKWWCQQSHCCISSTDKPQHWLGLYSVLNLQYKLSSTTASGKLVH